jgi:hypothetical protein
MTLQDLKYHVLLKLGVVAAGDSPNADDGATVELRYQTLHRHLTAARLTDWNVSADIPDEFDMPIIAMVAAESARDFGNTDPMLQAEGKLGLPNPSPAERQLRRLMSKTYVSTTARTEYF